ncbi:hypothetical protein C100_12460 [Sphingobium sp. C100]|uniref:alpha/beta hydrolase n=1 Tax=Sphingobium sp. C100 TaxID=1207055 RepID=UPI0003D5DE04|nr:alpha/beta hydrolase-fold protein [Sphingobium sp. C100]ETI63481.1 hypothetical protein C100_12460 [Sphingobium sp. C100]
MAANATQSMFNPLDRCTYLEIDSDHVGDRFAISISLPATYDLTDDPLPVLYVTDGNIAAPMTGGVAFSMFLPEAAIPCRPFIQVNIGYPEDGARRMLSTRNRDLVPPGERVAPEMIPYMRDHLGIDEGLAPETALDIFFDSYADGHGDRLLKFIEEELHPQVAARFRADAWDVGFFGYSFGGLLALYALSCGNRFFVKYGAGSPGIMVDDSVVFGLYETMLAAGAEAHPAHLHLSINIHEMEGPVRAYRKLAMGALRFLDQAMADPLPGLRISSEMIPGQDHEAGFIDAYRSFVRHTYRRG